jgi:hypothetical protein
LGGSCERAGVLAIHPVMGHAESSRRFSSSRSPRLSSGGAGRDALTGCERLTRAPGIRSARLRFRDGRVALRLSCPKGTTCRGRALLRSAKTLAVGSYRIGSGKRATIGLKASSAGRAAFRRAGVAKATLTVQPVGTSDAAGRVVTVR